MAAKQQANTVLNNYHSFEGTVKMSAYQPRHKTFIRRKWVTNGVNNVNLKLTKMRMMTPTNSSINAF
jgi:hypothetical protein